MLVIDDAPLVLLPALAVEVGLNEAVFLQQLFYWSQRAEADEDGDVWIFNTHIEWREQFPFWSARTIRRLLSDLEAAGHIKSRQPEGTNRRKHYALDRRSALFEAAKLAGWKRPDRPIVYKETETSTETTKKESLADEVWDHYVEVFTPRSDKADEGQRKVIRDALKCGTTEELCRCIDACFASDFHQRRGSGPMAKRKHNRLSDILKPKRAGQYGNGYTQRERIDFWLERGEETRESAGPTQDERAAWNTAAALFEAGEGPNPGPAPWGELPWSE